MGKMMTSGSKESYVDLKLKETISKIEKEAEIFNINRIEVDKSSAKYLVMTEDEISRFDKEDLAIAEMKLKQYAFCIQKYANQALAIKNWAERTLGLVVAKRYNDYDIMIKYEVKRDLTIKDDEYARRLFDVINEHQLKIDEFQYLAQSVQQVAESFGKMSRIRQEKYYDSFRKN